jgi:hypothetical protein
MEELDLLKLELTLTYPLVVGVVEQEFILVQQ